MSEMNRDHSRSHSSRSHGSETPRHRQNRRRAPEKKKRATWQTVLLRIGQVVGTLLLVAIVTGAFFGCYAAVYIKNVILPEATLDLSAYTMNENSVIYYQDPETNELKELQTLVGTENRQWVNYEDIPQDLINAVIAVEDKRFYEHNGVDWWRTGGAFLNMFLGMRNTYGGSTLTQQLIKNITEYDDVTVKRKVLEIFTALDLEKRYEKEDIITWYLNEIYLGQGCYGVQAASQVYFGKDVSELSLAECASLAGITNNPSLYSPYSTLEVTRYPCNECGTYSLTRDEECTKCHAINYGEGEIWTARDYNKARQEMILDLMADPDTSGDRTISQEVCDAAKAEQLVFRRDWTEEQEQQSNSNTSTTTVYSWYVDAVIDEVIKDLKEQTGLSNEVVTKMVYSGGLQIITPYDPDVQAAVDQVYNDRGNLNYVSKTGQLMKSGITIVDNNNGYVVALAGDVGEKTINRGWNCATDSLRQPGSSIKPLSVYAPALELGLITPASVSDDNPRTLNGRVWPSNAPAVYNGLTTILDAVTRSVNTVAVNVLDLVGFENSYKYMTEHFGITSLVRYEELENGQVQSDLNYSPLAMGGLTDGVSTFEMAAAYATFPRNGVYTEPTTYLMVKDADGEVLIDNTPSTKYVIDASTAYYINSMLTNVVSNGTGYNARVSGQIVAGKTGTTEDNGDLWFAGYTSHYTGVVWTGYNVKEYISQGGAAMSMWQKVMALVHEGLPRENFSTPSGLTTVSICRDCGNLATDDCAADIRGSRALSFTLLSEDVPREYCTCHVPVRICTECPILDANGKETKAYHLAGEYCPEESIKEVTMVDYQRTLASASVVVQDYYALMSIYETLPEEERTCTVHTAPEEPEEPENPENPEDPMVSPSPGVSAPPVTSDPVVTPTPTPTPSPTPSQEPEPSQPTG